ncbi:MAG: SIMPL domain-containing protein [Alphaproteobacteria bacterium]|nr:SIMPL domain-containing protein [Alphaproteobacteria bacterium]MDE2012459.1 SIMPL domain-containing protein [Alphaproteobacteria bacterium]MDE2072099.1 SIMPL domain-containing protein [Alphaproteobacteria bacterium]MDE2352779.1 SIMPL domain-containing protein [Alphaproteobacteria bacterium]
MNLVSLPRRTFGALATIAALALFATSAAAGNARPPHLLTVSGEGEASATPDQAQLSAGVVSEAKTAAEALAENSHQMNAVFAALKRMGIADKAIQTSGFSVSPQYPPYDSKEPRHIIGYQVSNSVSVKVDDLSRLGPALDALVAAGANQVNSVSFSIRDSHALQAKAREAAVKDAMAKAETYARAAGVSLGPIAAISESGAEPPRPMMMREESVVVTAQRTPVSPGEETVSADVTMSWEIP